MVPKYHEIAVDTMIFLDILFVELGKFSTRISDFFSFPYTRSFCRLAGTSRVESFSFFQTVYFYNTDVTFKSFSKSASASFSSVSSPFNHLCKLIFISLTHFLFFIILHNDDRLIPVCSESFLGVKWVWGCCSCKQTNSFIKSTFSSVLARPDLCLLSLEPIPLISLIGT